MAVGEYVIFGSENSPYSIKVRAFCEFKGVPHRWALRGPANEDEYKKVAKIAVVPAVRQPDGTGIQDSTPIMEMLEERFPEIVTQPPSPVLGFLSALLEEWGDEWGNKWMFHFRWARPIDQRIVALRLAAEMMPGADDASLAGIADMVRGRMAKRGFAVGSNEKTAPLLERSFADGLALLERHLAGRPFLLGSRPSFADFGVAAQIYEAYIDPTAGALVRESPRVAEWCVAMVHPRPSCRDGTWETWEALRPTLEPLLGSHVRAFLRWSAANSVAMASGSKELSVDLGDGYGVWWQTLAGPQKYQAKSLEALRRKYAAARSAELDEVLERCGCRAALVGEAPAQSKL